MRAYAKVAPTFWTGRTGKELRAKGPEAVIVAVYLMTSPHSNMLGLFYQPLPHMVHETGLSLEGATKGLRWAIEAGFCQFDEASEFVWVPSMAAYQIAKALKPKDHQCAGIQRDYDALPDNPFLGAFFERYREAFHLEKRRDSGADLPLKSPSPFGAPSEPHRSQEQEQEQEQAYEHPTDAGRRPAPPPCPHMEILDLWAEVLPELPRHLPSQWRGTRQTHLQARWRETAVRKNWTTKAEGLSYFRLLFSHVRASRFLMGQVLPTQGGRNPFICELEWLVRPNNWAKVIEGKYTDPEKGAA